MDHARMRRSLGRSGASHPSAERAPHKHGRESHHKHRSRARWVLAWPPVSEEELLFLATGEIGPVDEQRTRWTLNGVVGSAGRTE